jgi:hypothetical protein
VGTAAELLGQRGLSAAAYCLLLLLAPVALRWGSLPGAARRLGWLLLAQLGLWLGVVAAQQVYPPARTLLLVLLAFFLLLALVGQALWGRWRRRQFVRVRGGRPAAVGLLALVLVLYGGYRLRREQAIIGQHTRQQRALQQAYEWLRGQRLRRIWVGPRSHSYGRRCRWWWRRMCRRRFSPAPWARCSCCPPGRRRWGRLGGCATRMSR